MTAQRQLVVWEGGVPVVAHVPLITPTQVKDLHAAVLTELYREPWDDLAIEMGLPPSRFYGKTLIEVMLVKRAEEAARTGDGDQVEKILDRELGKAVARSENHNVNETYEQACLRIARETEKAGSIDAEVVESEPWEKL